MNNNKKPMGHITGKITDKKSGLPLFNVAISVNGQNKKTITDVTGTFHIENVESGECELECKHPEYKSHLIHKVNVMHNKAASCECQMVQRYTTKLNEPVLLLPLKLEIRKIEGNSGATVRVATFAQKSTYANVHNLRTEPEPPVIKSVNSSLPQYWLRWYPDDIQHITPVGQLSEQEKEDWAVLYNLYREKTSTTPADISSNALESLFTFEEFEKLIDFADSDLKHEWMKLADKYGVVRARQIAKYHTTDPTWDFDQQFPIYIDPLFQQDFAMGSFPSELRTQLSSQHQLYFSSDVQVIEGELPGKWRIKDLEEGIELTAMLDDNRIKIMKYSDDGSEAFDLALNNGLPCSSLPDEIHIYTVKDRKIEGPLITVPVQRDAIRIGLSNLESTKWMDEFDDALNKGMGCKITDVDKVKNIDEADWLIAVGMNEGEDSRTVFEEIIRRSNAAGEFSILSQDSPTNNSEQQDTDYQVLEDDIDSYLQKTKHRVNAKDVPKDLCDELNNPLLDAHRLQNLFKFDDTTISEMPGANLMEMSEATAMAILLWKPCIETQKPSLMARLGLTADAWDKIESFFYSHVRARGNFPIIKIDENPYGVLPIMAFLDYLNFDTAPSTTSYSSNLEDIYANFFKALILPISNSTTRLDSVPDADKYQILEKILQSAPVSSRVTVDLEGLGCPLVNEQTQEQPNAEKPYPGLGYLAEFSQPDLDPDCFYIDDSSPLLKRLLKYLLHLEHGVSFNSPPPMITGKVTDKQTGKGIAKATIIIANADPELITYSNQLGEYKLVDIPIGTYTLQVTAPEFAKTLQTNIRVGTCNKTEINFNLQKYAKNLFEPGKAVRLGHSVNQKNPAVREISGIIKKNQRSNAVSGVTVRLEGTERTTKTDNQGFFKFSDLPEQKNNYMVVLETVSGAPTSYNATVNEGTHFVEENPDSGFHIDRSQCNLHQLAANILKDVTPEKVEVLLLETLDLLSHRLDAWGTGLANKKLQECQINCKQAPPVGGFGWLEKPGQLSLSSFEPEFIQAPSVKQAATAGILRNASIFNGTDENSGAYQINLSSSQVQKGLWYFEGLRQGHLSGELLGFRLERMIYEESLKPGLVSMSDIDTLRNQYPLESQKDANEEEYDNKVLKTVIDGEKFLADEESDKKFISIKDRLNQVKDAASDIALCEVINADNNPELRGGWLDFLEGKVLPPREEFVRSKRTGKLQGTKVILPILAPEDLSFYHSSRNPRVLADPILASFCDSLIPDIGVQEISVEISNKKGLATRSMTILGRDLELDAIDLVLGGENELIRRTRAYVLACWKANDPDDLSVSSPCNILGKFPDFDVTNELLNEVRVHLLSATSSQDTLNIHTYLTKAKLIMNLLHKNESNTSGSTLHPREIPTIEPLQSKDVALCETSKILTERLDRIVSHLCELIIDLTDALGILKKRLMVMTLLRSIRGMLVRISTSSDTSEKVSIVERIQKSFDCLQDTDPELIHLLSVTPILQQISEINAFELSSKEVDVHISSLKENILGLEKAYSSFVTNSAKALIIDPKLRLNEISRFGIANALAVFPDSPTYMGANKINKTLSTIHGCLIDRLISMLASAPEFVSHLQFLKIFYQNTGEINDLLIQDSSISNVQQFAQRLPLTPSHLDFLTGVSFGNNNYYDAVKTVLAVQIKNLSSNISYENLKGNLDSLINLLKQGTDKKGMVILTPYVMHSANGIYPNWHLNLSNLTQLSDKGRLDKYQKVRPAIANLFSVFDDSQSHNLYLGLSKQSVSAESNVDEFQSNDGSTDYYYLCNRNPIETPYLTFLTIDTWTEGVANSEETTGVTLRYNVPQSEAPNLCLVCVPPNFVSEKVKWNADLLACSVYEAIELMKVRMVCTEDNSFTHLLNLSRIAEFDERGLPFDYEIDEATDSLFPKAKKRTKTAGSLKLDVNGPNVSI